jgi:hypothetical protein
MFLCYALLANRGAAEERRRDQDGQNVTGGLPGRRRQNGRIG